jgi:hypothetical protein
MSHVFPFLILDSFSIMVRRRGGGRQKKVEVETKKLQKFSQLNIRYRYKSLVFKHGFPVKILMFSQQKNWSHILSCVLNYLQIPLVIVL